MHNKITSLPSRGWEEGRRLHRFCNIKISAHIRIFSKKLRPSVYFKNTYGTIHMAKTCAIARIFWLNNGWKISHFDVNNSFSNWQTITHAFSRSGRCDLKTMNPKTKKIVYLLGIVRFCHLQKVWNLRCYMLERQIQLSSGIQSERFIRIGTEEAGNGHCGENRNE